MEDAVTIIATFLGGGLLGALVHHASNLRLERVGRRSSYIKEQIHQLYGPLYFLTGQNERLFQLSRSLLEAHSEYFDGQKWSLDAHTQNALRAESSETIELSNAYTEQVVKNNNAIVSLLHDRYALVDMDDVEPFMTFAIDVLRLEKEVTEGRLKRIPLNIYKTVGDISYSRPEFLARVKAQFESKQRLLSEYH